MISFWRRWRWWVILLCAILGGASGYEVARRTEPVYQASILLIVGDETSPSKLQVHDVQASVSLAGMYGALIRSQPVLERVAHQQHLGMEWQNLKDHIHVDLGQNDPLIKVSALAASGSKARTIATAVAKQAIAESPQGVGASARKTRAFLAEQASALEKAIARTDKEISRLQTAAHSSQRRLQSRIQLVRGWQGNYAEFVHLLASGGFSNTLRVLGNASSTARIRPFIKIDVAIGGGLGALAGIILVQVFLVGRRRKASEGSHGSVPAKELYAQPISTPGVATGHLLDPWIPELAGLPTGRMQSTSDTAA